MGITLLYAVLTSLFVFDLTQRQGDLLYRQGVSQATGLAETLAADGAPWLLAGNTARLKELVHGRLHNPNVQYAMIVSPEGRVLSHTDPAKSGEHLDRGISRKLLDAEPTPQVLLSDEHLVDVASPVIANNRLVGWARIGLSDAERSASLHLIKQEGLVYTLAAVTICALFAWLMGRGLGRDLGQLVTVAERVRRGEHDARATIDRPDELGQLGRDFNGMLDALGRHRQTIRDAQAELAASEERFDLAMRGANDGLWDWNITTGKVYFSPRWKNMLGYGEHELRNTLDEWNMRLHPDDVDRTETEIQAHLKGKTPQYETTYRIEHRDGSYRWHLARGIAVRDRDGKLYRMVGTVTDLTDRVQAEQALRASEETLAAAQNIAHIGSWNWDLAGQRLDWSDELYRILGLQPQECPAHYDTFLERVHPDDRSRVADAIRNSLDHGVPYDLEHRIAVPDDAVRSVHGQGQVFRDSSGQPVRMLGTLNDITRRKANEAALRQARDELERRVAERTEELAHKNQALDAALARNREAMDAKSEFLANMSHEIRTPMNGVLGMLGLLRDTELDTTQRDFTETAYASAENLLALLNDILDLSKIEAGKLKLEQLDFNLRNLVEDVVNLLAGRAHDKRLELACDLESGVPDMVVGDPTRVRQVLTNLLGNAIKFTEQGEVIVRVTRPEPADAGQVLRIEVRDTGIGIAPEQQAGIFDSFAQADGSTTRRFGGTGLGLSISRQLSELMGGHIGVHSTPGQGSTFWFTAHLPASSQAAAEPRAGDHLQGLRTLIVDDNATNRKILEHQLSAWGIPHDSAVDGPAALAALRDTARDGPACRLVLLDMMMPGMDGLEVAAAIKSDPQLAETRIVMLTSMGQGHGGDQMKAKRLDACLTKPVRQSQLYDTIVSVTGPDPGAAAPAARPGRTRPTTGAPAPTRAERILVVEDNTVNQKVALGMLQRLGFRADLADNGQKAVEALRENRYDLVFMDCQMPVMDGYEATAAIRRAEGDTGHTTVIAMTANAMRGDQERCLAAGMDDYLAKPIKADRLKAVLEHWLDGETQEHTISNLAGGTHG